MPNKLVLIIAALLAGVAVVFALTVPKSPSGDGAGNPEELASLKRQVAYLQKEMTSLRDSMGSAVATAAPSSQREMAVLKPVASGAAASAPSVGNVDRDAVFALIKEERDMRDHERAEKARQQARETTTKRVKAVAERLGLDAATTDALVKAYLDAMNREDDVRKAYPLADLDDTNSEKRRLELDAVAKDRDAAVAALVPADKRDDWDRRSRMLGRAGDFAEMGAAMSNGDFAAMGNFWRGGPGGGPGGGGFGPGGGGPGGNNNGNGGNNNPRRNRGPGQGGQTQTEAPAGGAVSTGGVK